MRFNASLQTTNMNDYTVLLVVPHGPLGFSSVTHWCEIHALWLSSYECVVGKSPRAPPRDVLQEHLK